VVATARVVLTAWAILPAAVSAQHRAHTPPPLGLDLFIPAAEYGRKSSDLVALGRRLFLDPGLSHDRSRACASCHRPERAFTDGMPLSLGVAGRRGPRNVPTLINRGWGRSFFWDGRTNRLAEQVLRPITSFVEMDMTVAAVTERLSGDATYVAAFREAFGRLPDGEALAAALAAYVRSIRSGGSRFDRLMDGDSRALSELERRGLKLFQGRARCDRCHFGPLLTDESFHNTGVAWRSGVPADSGRALVTGTREDIGAFKTPTLREVTRTAPYMHDGSLATLEEVVDFYSDGGRPNPYLDPLIRTLRLNEEDKAALVAFLGSLEGAIEEAGRKAPAAGGR
jgi:cytochrome c peroxidase